MKKRKLIVVPLAGLGNRMRVLSSCIEIAQKQGFDLFIAWPVNEELGCSLEDVFTSIGYPYKVPPLWQRKLLTGIYRTGVLNRYTRLFKLISSVFFNRSIFDKDVKNFNQAKLEATDNRVLVASCMAFSNENLKPITLEDFLKNETSREHFRRFIFNPSLRGLVDEEYRKIGSPYIGIHIRRTDHSDIIKHSPDKNFTDRIDTAIQRNPDQKFFLATDDPATREFYTRKYEGRIAAMNHKLSRADKEGVYAAVIELLLLSRATGMICSMISSYSNAAILIGDIKEVEYVDSFLT